MRKVYKYSQKEQGTSLTSDVPSPKTRVFLGNTNIVYCILVAMRCILSYMKITHSLFFLGFGFAIGAATVHGSSLLGSALFPDVPTGAYFDAAIGELYNKGVITGHDDGTFRPNDFVTRGQVAVMFQRFMNGGLVVSQNTTVADQDSSRSTRARSSSSTSSSSNLTANIIAETTISFTKEALNIPEKGQEISMIIARTGQLPATTVEYHTESATAKENSDFLAGHGTLSFDKDEDSQMLTIYIKDDELNEGSETFYITLKNPDTNATIGTIERIAVTILDDEDPLGTNVVLDGKSSQGTFAFSALEYGFAESGGTAYVTVLRTDNGTEAATVTYDTSNSTAVEGKNFKDAKGTLEFAAGEKEKTFPITVVDDDTIGGNLSAFLYIRDNGKILTKSSFIIVDDEASEYTAGKFKFEEADYDIQEGERADIIIFRLSGGKGDVTVDYATSAGSASPGSDYSETSGTMKFKDGEIKKSFSVLTKTDSNAGSEPIETVTIQLSNATGEAITTYPDIAILNIHD